MCRTSESIVFSIPDRNTLWIRTDDDLLVQAVAKYSTSNILGRDWREVASELSGSLPQQCEESYRITDTVVELTSVFLRVTFRDSLSLSVSSESISSPDVSQVKTRWSTGRLKTQGKSMNGKGL